MTAYDGPQLPHHYLEDKVFVIFHAWNPIRFIIFTIITLIVYSAVLNNHELSIFLRFGSGGALSSSTCFDLVDSDLVSGTTAGFVLFLTTTPFRIFLEESFLLVDGLAATGAADTI